MLHGVTAVAHHISSLPFRFLGAPSLSQQPQHHARQPGYPLRGTHLRNPAQNPLRLDQQLGGSGPRLRPTSPLELRRTVALSMPQLWTSIYTDHDCRETDDVCTGAHLPLVRCQLQLKRSRTLPVSVHFTDVPCTVAIAALRLAGAHCKQ